jgi:hypothetical protein
MNRLAPALSKQSAASATVSGDKKRAAACPAAALVNRPST